MAIESVTLPVARKIADMTQKELGDAVGVSESTVANWEKGKSVPSVYHAQRICTVLGRTFDEIIFLSNVAV